MDHWINRRINQKANKLKIIFLENLIPLNNQVPEKVYGCSYTLYPTPNLAILYNAAVLKNDNYEVSLFKLRSKEDLSKVPKADIYFIYSVILSYKSDINVGRKLKGKVFYFGPAATLYPEKHIVNDRSYVLRGETEHIVSKAIIEPQKTFGVSYKKSGKVIHNKTAGIIENIDKIPFPAREIDPDFYVNPKLGLNKFTNVLASRGCANHCYFCVPNSISWARELEWKKYNPGKPPVKARSAENVIQELKLLKKQGYSEISFIDDQFVIGKKRTISILSAIENIKFDFGILARADKLNDEEIVEHLACAKCKYVDIGAESFNQDVLDDIKKGIKVETVKKAIQLLAKHKVEPKLNIMFGISPKETKEIIEETIKETLSLPTDYCMFSIATPFPGTELEKVAKKNNWIVSNKEFNPAGIASISYPQLSNYELENIARKANYRFYYRPKVIINQLRKVKSLKSAVLLYSMIKNWQKNLKR